MRHKVASGNQSLDKHLVSYLGYLLGFEGNSCSYVIISKDKGYDEIIEFWKREGFNKISRASQIPKGRNSKGIKEKTSSMSADSNYSRKKIRNSKACKIEDLTITKVKDATPHKSRKKELIREGIPEKEAEAILNIYKRYDKKEIEIDGVRHVLYKWYNEKNSRYIHTALSVLGYGLK